MIAGTNDFARQMITACVDKRNGVLKEALLQYIMAFPVALKVSMLV